MTNQNEFICFKELLLSKKIIKVEYVFDQGSSVDENLEKEDLHEVPVEVSLILENNEKLHIGYKQIEMTFGLSFCKSKGLDSVNAKYISLDVSMCPKWSERLNNKVLDVKEYYESNIVNLEMKRVKPYNFINHIEVLLENNLSFYITASEFDKEKDELIFQCDEITVLFDKKYARKYQVIN